MSLRIKDIAVVLEFIRNSQWITMGIMICVMGSCASLPQKTPLKASPTAKAQSGSASETDFRVGAHTLLAISVYNEPDLSREVMVASDGTMEYPYIGKISVRGLTAGQIERKLKTLLEKDYLVHPQVNVEIKKFGQIYVFGKVMNPGIVGLKGGMTALEAVAEAGGFGQGATRDFLTVVRTVDGTKKTFRLSLRETETGSLDLSQSLRLLPQDTVIVQ